ncbi:MAG: hypothetical protein AB9907_06575 [Flexilinea sp.]
MRKRFLLSGIMITLSVFCIVTIGYAQDVAADDVTLIGNNQAIRSLNESKTSDILTSAGEKATLEINDAIVENDRILVRFLIWGLSHDWEQKITDQNRLYGNYLPIAELGIPSGKWLTPGSGSRISLVDDGNTMIIAGLLEFLTGEKPETVSFDFNQIPFDLEPLQEGAVIVLEFSEGDSHERKSLSENNDTKFGVTFSLLNSAQTPDISMLQPAISLGREDESLSRIGWVTVKRKDGKKYVLSRGNSYGFNITDDSRFVTGNAYTFPAIAESDPLTISMDYVYLTRNTSGQFNISFQQSLNPGTHGSLNIRIPMDEFQTRITGYSVYNAVSEDHEIPTLRLFMETEDALSKINLSIEGTEYTSAPSTCGFIPESDQFACDVILHTTDISELVLTYDSIEYRIDGNWSFEWHPIPLTIYQKDPEPEPIPVELDFSGIYNNAGPTFIEAVKKMEILSDDLSSKGGWILQRSETRLGIAGGDYPVLIDHAQKDLQMTNIIEETWDQIQEDGAVINNITIIKNLSNQIISGTWNTGNAQIVLPQGLLVNSQGYNSGYAYHFSYGSDFYSLYGTNAQLIKREDCELDNESVWCYYFSHSLKVSENSEYSPQNNYQFWIDKESGKILQKQIECQLNGVDAPLETCVFRKTLEVTHLDELTPEIKEFIESLQY